MFRMLKVLTLTSLWDIFEMASDINKRNVGDSARNNSFDSKNKLSNHVFDGAGENIHYHSDSESLGSRNSKTRYINAAIYVEQVEASHSVTSLHTDSSCMDVTPHPHSTYRSNSTPFLSGRVSSGSSTSVKRKSCRLVEHCTGQDETPRYGDRTYREDGGDTFRLSVASLSTTTTAKEERERNEAKKKEAFEKWCARKEQEKREKARLEKQKRVEAPAPSAAEREASYRHWLERKRAQAERARAEALRRRFRDAERAEQERERRQRAKDKLEEWIRKKEEDIKVMKTREERRAGRAAIEEQRKRAEGERAYRDWLRTSKNKPLPVPLNQGELSMRGSVSKMYVNPIPWQAPT